MFRHFRAALAATVALAVLAQGPLAAAQNIGYYIDNAGKRVPVTPATPLPVTGGGGGGGGGAVFGPTAAGTQIANPPAVVGGSSDGTGTGNVQPWYIDTSGFGHVFVTNSFSLEATQLLLKADLDALAAAINSAIPAGSALIGHTDGAGAAGASVAGNPNRMGCRAATATPTAVSDGQLVDEQCTATGKRIMDLYSVEANRLRGYGSTTAATATTMNAAQGVNTTIFVTRAQCYNTSATDVTVTFNDTAGTTIIVPHNSGNNPVFDPPLKATATNTAFTFTVNVGGQTTIGCADQGYFG